MKNAIFALSLALAMPLATVGCADENDPATWVKRLDDPAQRTNAIKRLGQFYEDALTSDGNKRDGEHVKKVADVIVEPLTKTYTAGGLDDKTRNGLQNIIQGSADQYRGKAEQAREAARYFNPALSSYFPYLSGVARTGETAEAQAAANRFDEAGKSLLKIIDQLA